MNLTKPTKSNTLVYMPIDGIEWDTEKAKLNLFKHRVSFETAQYIFSDPERIDRIDNSEGNTSGETRCQTIGKVDKTLFVVHAETGTNKRLIMARLATKAERKSYNGYYQIDGKGWAKA
ncbi:hypothetical protein AGMMS50212_00720 [Spirochaetia bacterium]|nr:hypothetical protein AGMMS50212_00720 [Spirochaetia bacterium]